MSDSTALLVRAVARAFADGRRVLWFGADPEGLLLLAEADVKELVAVVPEAEVTPEGTTLRGAPLRLRADLGERRSSKDLVVDPAGQAPAEAVLRILKKEGIYLAGARGPALAALRHVTAVPIRHSQALVTGQGLARAVVLDPGVGGEGGIFVGAQHAVIAAPSVVCTVPGGPAAEALPAAAVAADAEARAQEAEAHLLEAMGRFSKLESALDQARAGQQAALEVATAARAQVEGLEAALAAAEASRDGALTAQATLQAQAAAAAGLAERLAALEADYAAVRDELAERRVADRRADAVRARFEAARAAMTAEVDQLKARLRAVDEDGADRAALRGERDAARAALTGVLQAFGECLELAAPAHPAGAPPPSSDQAAIDAWLATARIAAARAGAASAEGLAQRAALAAERPALRQRVRELAATVEVLQAELAEAQTAAAGVGAEPGDEALQREVAALRRALEAVEAQRRAEQAAAAQREASAAAARAERERLQAGLAEARRQAARAALGRAALEDRLALQAGELALRSQRSADLEGMLAAHERMHGLLNEALAEAELRRDEAEAARRLADENLAILRKEFERRAPAAAPEGERAALQRALQAALRKAADAERRAVGLEERVSRLQAERAVRGA